MLKVAICGGSGYTGAELLRILKGHPHVEVTAATSEKSAGKSPADLYGHLREYSGLKLVPMEKEKLLKKADLFFMALPHGESQEAVDFFYKAGKKAIDLSADYRLRDALVYEKWYKTPHRFKETLKKAVFGLPELYRNKIKKASLIANPGCYPTGAILGLYPAIKAGLIDTGSIVIDSKSGTTGAGRKADIAYSFCEVNEGFRAYAIGTHRHTPEIEQELSRVAGKEVLINFTPHLLPVDRGILTTIYAGIKKTSNIEKIASVYRNFYEDEPFVRVLDAGNYPNIKFVRGSNRCDIGLFVNDRTESLIIVTAIDNLVKGASGQAVHNMNIMMGWDEKTAIEGTALFP